MSEAELINALRTHGADTGYPQFAERMVSALQEGLAVLDALPRDDAFWHGWANDRATVAKLSEYAGKRLEQDPGDRTARWALIALSLGHGSNDGGLPLLGPEIAADPAVVADALVIADWIWQGIGLDNTEELREVCALADRAVLEALARADGGEAVREVLRILDGGRLREDDAATSRNPQQIA